MSALIRNFESIVSFFFVGFSFSCSEIRVSHDSNSISNTSPNSKRAELTEQQAVEFAEIFIRQNGYTDLKPDVDELVYESLEWDSDPEKIFRSRYNTLERWAFGISNVGKNNQKGWTVGFRYVESPGSRKNRFGRAVTMNLDGSQSRVEHKDFILTTVEKKL